MRTADLPAVPPAFLKLKDRATTSWQSLWDGKKPVILVGTATCGRAAGARGVLQVLREQIKKHQLDCPVREVGCRGDCHAEPLVMICKPGFPPLSYGPVDAAMAETLVQRFILGNDPCLEYALGDRAGNDLASPLSALPQRAYGEKVILQNCGRIDAGEIDHYIACGGYAALAKALGTAPEEIIGELRVAGLRGRGGAGFPTWEKWDLCRRTPGRSRYVVCNGDEGDPGAFMDRAILESDPHSVIEGMIIAGYTLKARRGYLYLRAEYPLAVERIRTALYQAKKLKLLGKNILGSDFTFDIRLFLGSGAFVCGEETALIASLEGKPGLPQHRPPYPTVKGLQGKPTLINNVKTFAYVRHIIMNGGQWFARTGTEGSSGTAVFALAGKVVKTGLVEVPMGTTLRQVIFDIGGGIPAGKRFKAVQIGGPSGGCLPESALDLPIAFASLSEAGAMMGSGGIIVLDEDDCLVEMARYFLEFTQRESCGKCTFCRLGTKQMLALLEGITKGQGKMEDLDTLSRLAQDMQAGSLCNLGKTAPNPVLTTLRYFREEYEAHIREGRCPALMCRDLIAYHIRNEECSPFCLLCRDSCPMEAITLTIQRDFQYCQGWRELKVIDRNKCVKCGSCFRACPLHSEAAVKLSPPEALPARKQLL